MSSNGKQAVILASGSEARRRLLSGAGVAFDVVVPDVDEVAIREALVKDTDGIAGDDLAEILARTKAEAVSRAHPDAVVIGGDQVLSLGDRIFDKPADDEAAREQLLALRGAAHQLHSAVAIAEHGEATWCVVADATVTMRDYSPRFVGQYMAMVGDAVHQSVGGYHVEGVGAQLIAGISGDLFVVQGLPLFQLLAELRARSLLVT